MTEAPHPFSPVTILIRSDIECQKACFGLEGDSTDEYSAQTKGASFPEHFNNVACGRVRPKSSQRESIWDSRSGRTLIRFLRVDGWEDQMGRPLDIDLRRRAVASVEAGL